MRRWRVGFVIAPLILLPATQAQSDDADIKGRWVTAHGVVEIYPVRGACDDARNEQTQNEKQKPFRDLKKKICGYVSSSGERFCGRVVGINDGEGKEILAKMGKAGNKAAGMGLPVLCVERKGARFQGGVFNVESIAKDTYAMEDHRLYLSRSGDSLNVRVTLARLKKQPWQRAR